jgi:hypothetical protein
MASPFSNELDRLREFSATLTPANVGPVELAALAEVGQRVLDVLKSGAESGSHKLELATEFFRLLLSACPHSVPELVRDLRAHLSFEELDQAICRQVLLQTVPEEPSDTALARLALLLCDLWIHDRIVPWSCLSAVAHCARVVLGSEWGECLRMEAASRQHTFSHDIWELERVSGLVQSSTCQQLLNQDLGRCLGPPLEQQYPGVVRHREVGGAYPSLREQYRLARAYQPMRDARAFKVPQCHGPPEVLPEFWPVRSGAERLYAYLVELSARLSPQERGAVRAIQAMLRHGQPRLASSEGTAPALRVVRLLPTPRPLESLPRQSLVGGGVRGLGDLSHADAQRPDPPTLSEVKAALTFLVARMASRSHGSEGANLAGGALAGPPEPRRLSPYPDGFSQPNEGSGSGSSKLQE